MRCVGQTIKSVNATVARVAGTGGSEPSGGHLTPPPPEIYLGVQHYILTPRFFGKKYFLVHTHTFLLRVQVKVTLGLGLFVCLLSFLNSAKCDPHDFDF